MILRIPRKSFLATSLSRTTVWNDQTNHRASILLSRPYTISHLNRDKYVNPDAQAEIIKKTDAITIDFLGPLNKRLMGPLERYNDQMTSLPFVFLLGNHSSGKSSFINSLLGRNIQTTGVAPTDDSFTIIAPGDVDVDQDGPTMVGDPDLGFAGLRQFGPPLIHHTVLKVRKELNVDFMLVDSPGMIDSPMGQRMSARMIQSGGQRYGDQGQIVSQQDISDRGYDFKGVTRWFAERADVILLFFDPDKPGTTGETLEILTSSLVGMDHKLHIVMNKVDQFRRIHDFARAYGSLCWNLSKVIPRKDLPRIYTMYIPGKEPLPAGEDSGLTKALEDLDGVRQEVISEVLKAPERRVDNVITRLYDSTCLVQMHATLFESVRQKYTSESRKRTVITSSVFLAGSSLSVAAFYAGVPIEFTGAAAGFTLACCGAIHYFNKTSLEEFTEHLTSESGLTDVFRHHYSRHIIENDEFVFSLWKRVLPQLMVALKTIGMGQLPKVRQTEIDQLRNIIDLEVPRLRRLAAPPMPPKSLADRFKLFGSSSS